MTDFKSSWDRHDPSCNPVGYMMRETGARHWLRLHSLPESKRYPETNAEQQTLLARHNELADDILGRRGHCWLAQTCWESPDGQKDAAPGDRFWPCRDHALSFSYRFVVDEGDHVTHAWKVYAAPARWDHAKFDKLLLAISNWEVAPTLWLAGSGAVFAPYDGGIDLFLPTLSQVEMLTTKYSDWLSPHPQGL